MHIHVRLVVSRGSVSALRQSRQLRRFVSSDCFQSSSVMAPHSTRLWQLSRPGRVANVSCMQYYAHRILQWLRLQTGGHHISVPLLDRRRRIWMWPTDASRRTILSPSNAIFFQSAYRLSVVGHSMLLHSISGMFLRQKFNLHRLLLISALDFNTFLFRCSSSELLDWSAFTEFLVFILLALHLYLWTTALVPF